MFCEINPHPEIENRRKVRAPESNQFLLSLYCFLGSFLLKLKYLECLNWSCGHWVDLVFYTSSLWLTYLIISLVFQFKSSNLTAYFRIIDYMIAMVQLGLWAYLLYFFIRGKYLGCTTPANMFGVVYLVLGGIVILGILGNLLGLNNCSIGGRKKTSSDKYTDFNPYN